MVARGNRELRVRLENDILKALQERACSNGSTHLIRDPGKAGGVSLLVRQLIFRELGLEQPPEQLPHKQRHTRPVPTNEQPTRDPLDFLPGVAERLGYYVYMLIDPRDGRPFYVGKGLGARAYSHAREAEGVLAPENQKLSRIQDILRLGLRVQVEIIRHGLSEECAFEVEGAVTDALALSGVLTTNSVSPPGCDRGWRPLEDLMATYSARPVVFEPEHRVVLIRINRQFRATMSPTELYEATRGWWRINPNRRAEYAFSVFGGIVRAVYSIESWSSPNSDKRRAFTGRRDPSMENRYLFADVSAFLRQSAQNPIKYINC